MFSIKLHKPRFVIAWILILLFSGRLQEPAKGGDTPYMIGISPSHITQSPEPFIEKPHKWKEVLSEIDLYKYHAVQIKGLEWTAPFFSDINEFAGFMQSHGIAISCEFGSFHGEKEDFTDRAVDALRPVFDAGYQVEMLTLDDPVRRRAEGKSPRSLEAISEELLFFYQEIRNKFPTIKIGYLANYPNWNFSKELPGKTGIYTQNTGLTFQQVLEEIEKTFGGKGEKLDFIEIDNPYNYYQATATIDGQPMDGAKKLKAIQDWCSERNIDFYLIINSEPHGRSENFYSGSTAYIKDLSMQEIAPDMFMIQSWYEQPEEHLPESKPWTFTYTARAVIRLINKMK